MSTKGENELMQAIDYQFDIAAPMLENRMEAFKAKEECRTVMLKVFRAMEATDYADLLTKLGAKMNAILVLRGPEILSIRSKIQMAEFMQTILLKDLGIEVTDEEREAYKIYASKVSSVAAQVLNQHVQSIMSKP